MPVISISFNRFLGLLVALFTLIPHASGQLPSLSKSDLGWLGAKIYQNECNSQYQCLTSWNSGEDFPSLGIGHFIWYQADQLAPFEETFPALLKYLESRQTLLPVWLATTSSPESPWPNREAFYQQIDSPRMIELRDFLLATQAQQTQFIANRLAATLPEILNSTSGPDQARMEENFYRVANSSLPYGLYALIDYVHFKGTGLKETEQYQGQGWGLKQVLLAMEPEGSLSHFVEAAEYMLTRRVENAPANRNEQRWLQGWKNRLQTYLPK